MTHATRHAPRLAAIPAAAVAALLLAGCSTGHVGEAWQCPLAEGGLCDSVAAADPAVPDPGATDGTGLAEPLWRVRGSKASTAAEPSCAADCDGGFDPFAWLQRLFAAEAHADEARPAGRAARAPGATAARPSDPVRGEESAAPAEPPPPLRAEAGPSQDGPVEDNPAAGDLRTGEVVARIWIAPFVDADGVYREASWVRIVLEPAGWRLR